MKDLLFGKKRRKGTRSSIGGVDASLASTISLV